MIDDLGLRTTEMFAHTLGDWTDDEVGQLNAMLARLRDSFGDCRAPHVRTPHVQGPETRPPTRTPA